MVAHRPRHVHPRAGRAPSAWERHSAMRRRTASARRRRAAQPGGDMHEPEPTPTTPTSLEPVGGDDEETSSASAAADDRGDEAKLEDGVALCLSGGGSRALLYHVGALWRLNELG